jgi:hypothetical protein
MICLRKGSLWPWNLVVHEDGQRTLLLTILYFEHAAREMPLDILLGVAIGGSVFFAFPRIDHAGAPRRARNGSVLAWTTGLVIVVILAGTAIGGGIPLVLDNVLQNHTRPGAALAWGSHWRYHLLERIALMLIAIGFAGLLRLLGNVAHEERGRAGLVAAWCSVGVYLAFTVLFSSGALVFEPFFNAQYLGHQARELLTHALVTFPIGWGVCMLRVRDSARSGWPANPLSRHAPASATIVVAMSAGTLGILAGGYVCIAALMADAVSHGQTPDLAMLIFPHFFEHSFTYVLVPLVAAVTYEVASKRALTRRWLDRAHL